MKNKTKTVLQEQIRFHNIELKKHNLIYGQHKSKRQREKIVKHMHKRFQTIKIAEELGFEVCPCCGNIK